MADGPMDAGVLTGANNVSKQVVKSLADRPAYLLLYGVCFLLFTVSVVFLFQHSGDADRIVKLTPVVAACLSLLVALFAVLVLEPRQRKESSERVEQRSADAPVIVPAAVVDELSALAAKIESGLRQGTAEAPPPIQEQLRRMSSEWGDIAKNAGEGRLRASGARYNQILVGMYSSAVSTVFSTSIHDFLVGWGDTALGDAVLQAHQQSTASVTRVFIFDRLEEVDAMSREVMQRQQQTGRIAVRVYVNKTDPFFHFSPHEGRRDFTIIDDRVCAFTEEYGPGKFTADWYFSDKEQLQRALDIRKDLTKYSLPLDEWLAKHPPAVAAVEQA